MMSITEAMLWIAVAGLAITLGGVMWRSGKREGRTCERLEMIENELKQNAAHHQRHYQHAKEDQAHHADTEAHWTPRERNRLETQLADIAKKLDQLLGRQQ